MIYQYRTSANKSPIAYISPKTDKTEYLTTVKSLKNVGRCKVTLVIYFHL